MSKNTMDIIEEAHRQRGFLAARNALSPAARLAAARNSQESEDLRSQKIKYKVLADAKVREIPNIKSKKFVAKYKKGTVFESQGPWETESGPISFLPTIGYYDKQGFVPHALGWVKEKRNKGDLLVEKLTEEELNSHNGGGKSKRKTSKKRKTSRRRR